MYKNQLQELAQRSCFNLPSYASVRGGPDHAPHFKATVTFNGEAFESPTFCSTLRQAEHAAAEVALNTLSKRGPSQALAARILDETRVCKNLLQETAQRAGIKLPVYKNNRLGPEHSAMFACTVELVGLSFTGELAKTKKQAEKNAATEAWSCLKQRASQAGSSTDLPEAELNQEQEQNAIARFLSSACKGDKAAWVSGSLPTHQIPTQLQQRLPGSTVSKVNFIPFQESSGQQGIIVQAPYPPVSRVPIELNGEPAQSSGASQHHGRINIEEPLFHDCTASLIQQLLSGSINDASALTRGAISASRVSARSIRNTLNLTRQIDKPEVSVSALEDHQGEKEERRKAKTFKLTDGYESDDIADDHILPVENCFSSDAMLWSRSGQSSSMGSQGDHIMANTEVFRGAGFKAPRVRVRSMVAVSSAPPTVLGPGDHNCEMAGAARQDLSRLRL